MAKDDDSFAERRRSREREAEQQEKIKTDVTLQKPGSVSLETDQIVRLLEQATPLIEQVNNLYNQFMSGAERLPPTERRKQLDQVMATIQAMSKPTQTIQFRANALIAHYQTNRDRWDKLMRDLESGKIKRATRGR